MPEFPNVCIPSYADLLLSIPRQYRTKEVKKQLHGAYERELDVITDHIKKLIKQGKPFAAHMMIFDLRDGAYQSKADFSVSELSQSEKPELERCGQKVCRWVYTGCIQIDLRALDNGGLVITTHH